MLSLLLLLPAAPAFAIDTASTMGSSTYIVGFAGVQGMAAAASADAVNGYVASWGGRVKYRYGIIDGVAVTVPDALAAQLAAIPGVRYVEKAPEVRVLLDQAVPQIGADLAWAGGYSGKGVKVAVLDTGVDGTHPDLANRVTLWYDFTDEGYTTPHDGFGHGTHVSGIIAGNGAASGGKYRGVAPNSSLIEGKVLRDDGSGTFDEVIAGVDWAVQNGAQVISLSIGGGHYGPMDEAVRNAVDKGVVVVAAAGNEGPGEGTLSCPGDSPDAITVGAVDKGDLIADFSSRGPEGGIKPDVANVGVDIVAARASGTTMGDPRDQYYIAASGTSMATPMTAGVVALMLEKNPSLTPAQVKYVLGKTAKPAGGGQPDNVYGHGRVNALYAVDNATYSSLFVADSLPSSPGTVPGTTASISVTMRNDGAREWSRANNVTLHALDDAAKIGPAAIELPSGREVEPGGQYTWTFSVRVTASKEYNLTYRIYANNTPVGDGIAHRVRVKGEITPGILGLNSTAYSVNKEQGTARVRVDRLNGRDNAVTVNYTVGGGTAMPGVDYVPENGTLTFMQDQDHAFVDVALLNNSSYDGERTVNLTLANVTGGAALGRSSAVLTVNDTYANFTWHLSPGWNLISMPLVPRDASISSLLPADAKANLTIVWAYDNSDPKAPVWRFYKPSRQNNTLSAVEAKTGYWFLMTNDTTMSMTGLRPANDTLAINDGWNLVGCPGPEGRSPSRMFGEYYLTWEYEDGQWYYYKPSRANNTLSAAGPGHGYWVLKA